MVIVKITSPGVGTMVLEVEDEEVLSHFLIVNGQSDARDYLLKVLDSGYLEGRPEWNGAQMMKELEVTIPTLNVEYIIREVQGEKQLVQEQPQKEQQNKKTVTKWTYNAVLRLIYQWNLRRIRFENNTEKNEIVWEDLTEAMVAVGLEFTSLQCESKFKYIKRVYMETKDYNRKSTGQPEKTCPFFEQLDDIFKKSAQACPPTLVSSRDGAPNQSSVPTQLSGCSSNETAENTATNTMATENDTTQLPKKRTKLESSLTKWAEKFQEKSAQREASRQKRHEELMQVQRETNDLYKSMMLKLLEKI